VRPWVGAAAAWDLVERTNVFLARFLFLSAPFWDRSSNSSGGGGDGGGAAAAEDGASSAPRKQS